MSKFQTLSGELTVERPTPRVCIGMPVYNAEEHIRESLDSLLAQTYGDFRLIISDNASTDSTAEICKDYARKDDRIQFVQNDINVGAGGNYNKVFELSDAEYFKWAASDDVCAPEYVKSCVDVLDNEPDVVLCYTKTTIIDGNGKVLSRYEDGLNMTSDSATGRFAQVFFNCGLCNAVMGLMRSSALRATNQHEDYVGCDKVLLAELSLVGKFREVPDYLFLRRFPTVVGKRVDDGTAIYEGSFVSRSETEQLEWLDPKQKSKPGFGHWRRLKGYTRAISRAPIQLSRKFGPRALIYSTLLVNPNYWRELSGGIGRLLRSK
jgi:glycosyltransferase involved in cell wall biosynthesis